MVDSEKGHRTVIVIGYFGSLLFLFWGFPTILTAVVRKSDARREFEAFESPHWR